MTFQLIHTATGTGYEFSTTGIEVDPTTGEHIDCGNPEPTKEHTMDFTFSAFQSLYARLNATEDLRDYQGIVVQAFAEASAEMAARINSENFKMADLGYYDYISVAIDDLNNTKAGHIQLIAEMDQIIYVMVELRKWDTAIMCTRLRNSQALYIGACDSLIAKMVGLEEVVISTFQSLCK